jgi:hypothetical protein
VVIPFRRWDRLAEKALRYSLLLSRNIIAIHLARLEGSDDAGHAGRLRRQWRKDVEEPMRQAGIEPPKLLITPSPYRSFVGHLLQHVAQVTAEYPGHPVAVVIPEIVREHWRDYLLLGGLRAWRLRTALLRHGGTDLAVVTVPWAREAPHPEKLIEREEPGSAQPPNRPRP